MPSPTTLLFGAYAPLTDSLVAHPSSPTGATINLNDGATFSIYDDERGNRAGFGGGLVLSYPQPQVYKGSNSRVVGEHIERRNYTGNRLITVSLYLGRTASWSAFSTAIHQLALTLEGVTKYTPGCLEIQLTTASAPVYADVREAHLMEEYQEVLYAQNSSNAIVVYFECAPMLRGPRQTLQNLANNPGFTAPSGPGVPVFNDTFANTNAYTQVAGSAPSIAYNNTYVDIIQSDTPLRYYRLDEASGTACMDISGNGANGTYTGSPTLGVTGAISGDTDTAVTFNGSTQYMSSASTVNLPTGSATVSLECWVKFSANPSALVVAHSIGNWTSPDGLYLGILSTGKAEFGIVGASTVDSGSALSLGVWHHLVGTFSGGTGGTLTLYVDGASQGTMTGTPTLSYTSGVGTIVGTNQGNTHPFAGSVDEACVYASALSSTRVTAHYNAGHSGATGTQTNVMSVPSGATITFGSPIWQAINTWQIRFQFLTGLTASFYLHYADANDWLICEALSTGVFRIRQNVAGVTSTVVSASVTLTHEAWYWVQMTQFPGLVGNDASNVTATLSWDQQGAIGASVVSLTPTNTVDATAGLTGKCGIMASGAALNVGGAYNNVSRVNLFGPGGWLTQSFGTGVCSGAWEQTTANCYPNGPLTGYGAARIDVAPAGTADVGWRLYAAGATGGGTLLLNACPAIQGQVLSASVWVKSTGLSANALIRVTFTEYSSSGAQKAQSTVLGLSGNQAAWTQLSDTYTVTNAATALVDVMWRVSDTAVAGESAGATVWFDNCQVYNQTTTGQTSMPYCELRFPQSPAQLVVSGLLGDAPAPAFCALGTYYSSWAPGSTLNLALGRRAFTAPGAQLVHTPAVFTLGLLDSASYGGYYAQDQSATGFFTPGIYNTPHDCLGTFALYARVLSQQSSGNLKNLTVRDVVFLVTSLAASAFTFWDAGYPFVQALPSSYTTSTWTTLAIGGPLTLPPTMVGALTDPTQNLLTVNAQFYDSTSPSTTYNHGWGALVPVDGPLLLAQTINASNSGLTVSSQWLWVYVDGLGTQVSGPGGAFGWTYSLQNTATPAPAAGGGGTGTLTTGSISVNPNMNPYLTLDPALNSNGVNGVNQLVGIHTDSAAGAVLPLHAEIQYSPLYLWPN